MYNAVARHRALCCHQGLCDHLTAKNTLPTNLRAASTKDVDLDRFKVQRGKQRLHRVWFFGVTRHFV